jgi:hypothetical protein
MDNVIRYCLDYKSALATYRGELEEPRAVVEAFVHGLSLPLTIPVAATLSSSCP